MKFSIPVIFCALLCPGNFSAAAPQPLAEAAAPDSIDIGIDHLRNLEYDAARKKFEAYLGQHPNDLRALYYLASTILQREMFQRELLESRVYASGGEAFRDGKPPISPAFQAELFGVLTKLETLGQARIKLNPSDEPALYWLGMAHATRAIFQVAVAHAYVAALGEGKEAHLYHERLLNLNPGFVDAHLVIGIYDYIVGCLPWYVKVLASVAGHHGERKRGLTTIEQVTREGHWARDDAKQFLAIFYFREKRYAEARALAEDLARSYPRNFVLPQEIARTYKAEGNWRAAAEVYEQMLARYHNHEAGYAALPAAKVLYQAGEAYSQLGDLDQALRLYAEAARQEAGNIYVYRAELAAAGLYQRQNRIEEARRKLEHVAGAIPSTDEGKAARQNLKELR